MYNLVIIQSLMQVKLGLLNSPPPQEELNPIRSYWNGPQKVILPSLSLSSGKRNAQLLSKNEIIDGFDIY